jgi:hypothetical protein
MGSIFRVHCEFFIKADKKQDVVSYCEEDILFTDRHVMVDEVSDEEATLIDEAEIEKDLT